MVWRLRYGIRYRRAFSHRACQPFVSQALSQSRRYEPPAALERKIAHHSEEHQQEQCDYDPAGCESGETQRLAPEPGSKGSNEPKAQQGQGEDEECIVAECEEPVSMEQMVDGTRGTTARTLKAGDLMEHADWIDAVMSGREVVEHEPGSDYSEN